MGRGEKQAGCYMQAGTLAARWLSSMFEGRWARSRGIVVLLVAIAATGCGRTSRTPARADGGDIADTAADRGPVISPKQRAEPCTSAGECASGFCADGVCCSSACTERCKTCAAPSSLGDCAFVRSGVAPRGANDCPASAPSTCGLDGRCDGAGACRSYVAGTECGGRACQGSFVASVSTCDGAGWCQPGMPVDCAPYLCDPISGTCFSSCTSEAQCEGGLPCVNGSCFMWPLDECTGNGECASGFCVDGVCCTSACEGPCESCGLVGSIGICTPVAVGAPDPHGICRNDMASTCGQTGLCDGAGGCDLYPGGTTCAASSCSDGVLTSASACNGIGACVPGRGMSCSPFACNPVTGNCFNTCDSDAQCEGGVPCLNGSCFLYSPVMPCSVNAECASGFCASGVCCDSACEGPCVSCNLVRSVGTCTPVAAGFPDPSGICRNDMASTCGQTGLCDGAGSCDTYPQGTVCAPSSCSDGFGTPVSVCDGKGTCTSGAKSSCGPFGCAPNGSTCSRGCPGGDAICTSGNYYCTGDEQCAAKQTIGEPCASNHECLSGVCANGVCCDGACEGPCQSCNQPGSEGRCMPLPRADGGLVCGSSTDAAED